MRWTNGSLVHKLEPSNTTPMTIKDALKKYPKARRIAVENFALGREGRGTNADRLNLEKDAALYNWNQDTQRAIKEVLGL
jgi:hypothetical protein